MPIAWYPTRRWDWCMSEDEKKEAEKLCNDESSIKLMTKK